MPRCAPPPEAWLRKLLWSVLDALRVLHDGNTLHRDISPDNIFLQDNGPPVLLDLGAARHAINDQDRKHTAVLKVNYAPIEQYSDGDEELRQGPWSDLYSLAAVMHGCLANDTPLPATLRSIRDRMVSFSRIAKTVKRQFGVEYSAPFVAAIAQSLALRPEDRPQSIDAFLQTMEMTSAPDDVQHFDFRAELGDIWVEPADQPGPGLATPTVDVTSAPKIVAEMQAQAQREDLVAAAPASDASRPGDDFGGDTVMLAGPDTVAADAGDTVFIDAGDTVVADDDSRFEDLPHHRSPGAGGSRAADRRSAPLERDVVRSNGKPTPSPRRSPLVAGIVVAALVAVVAGAGWRWSQGSKPPRDEIITEMAERPAAAAASDAALVEVSAPAAAGGDAQGLSSDGAVASASAASAAAPAPAFVVASAPKPSPGWPSVQAQSPHPHPSWCMKSPCRRRLRWWPSPSPAPHRRPACPRRKRCAPTPTSWPARCVFTKNARSRPRPIKLSVWKTVAVTRPTSSAAARRRTDRSRCPEGLG